MTRPNSWSAAAPRPGRRLCDRDRRARVAPAGLGRGPGAPRLGRWHRPLSRRHVHHPEELAVVHGGRRPDRPQHRRRAGGPQHQRATPLLQLDARTQPLHPAALGRASTRRAGRPGLRHFVDDRYRLVASTTFDVRAPLGRQAPAADQPAGGPRRVAWQPRLDPDRVHRHRRSGGDRRRSR